jgi:enamine deaminase RidA (YjgF/YER057c/UK114 family)
VEDGLAEIERFGVARRWSDFIVYGDLIHFSGYVAEEAAGKSVAEQTRDILAQVDQSLADGVSDKSRLIEATIWLADTAGFDDMNAVWDAWVAPGRPPTSACVLASPEYAVEIRVLAAR